MADWRDRLVALTEEALGYAADWRYPNGSSFCVMSNGEYYEITVRRMRPRQSPHGDAVLMAESESERHRG